MRQRKCAPKVKKTMILGETVCSRRPRVWASKAFSWNSLVRSSLLWSSEEKLHLSKSIRLPVELKKGPIHAKLNAFKSKFIKQSLGLALFKSGPYFVVAAAAVEGRNCCLAAETLGNPLYPGGAQCILRGRAIDHQQILQRQIVVQYKSAYVVTV